LKKPGRWKRARPQYINIIFLLRRSEPRFIFVTIATLRMWEAAMSKPRAVGLIVLFLAGVSGPAGAQELAGRVALTPLAGVIVPAGDFASTGEVEDDNMMTTGFAKTGFAIGGALEYYFTENVAGGLRFYYDHFYVDDRIFDNVTLDVVGAHYRALEMGLYVKYLLLPHSVMRPYGKAAILMAKPHGMASVDFGTNADTEISFDATWGIELAAGVNIRKSRKISYILEAGFTQLATDGKTVEAGLAGLAADGEMMFNAQWFALRAGVIIFLNSW
jgi:hypothetical protein